MHYLGIALIVISGLLLGSALVRLCVPDRNRRPSGSPAGESEGWTRKTWPSAPKHNERD